MNILDTMRNATSSARHIGLAIVLSFASAGIHSTVHAQVATPPAPSTQSAPQETRVYFADAILAVVNNEVITRQELVKRMEMVENRMRNQGIPLPSPAQFQRQVLENMIIDRAQMQLAREYGIRVDDVTLDRAIARIAEQNGMSMQEFRTRLEQDGTPFSVFREEIREEITIDRLHEREVDSKVQVSDSEIDNFLAAQSGFAQPQQEYNVSHILVRIPEKASAEQIAASRQRAEKISQQLRAGGDFTALAASHSDATDALSGGDLGWRGSDRLPQLYVETVDDLQQGEVSPVVKSPNGFHILKLNGKRTSNASKDGTEATVQQTHVRHILIKVNQIVSAADAKRRLTELKQRLEHGAATFEELAKLHSNDLSASRGGDIGWVYPGDTVPAFERAMNALKPGEISEPIESPFGYHLIQVVERKQADVSEERRRLIARQIIRERKIEEATQDWLRQLRDRAYVEYRFDNEATS